MSSTQGNRLATALQREGAAGAASAAGAAGAAGATAPPFLGASPVILQLQRDAIRAGRSSAAVLITGESGTGKEMLARTIHASSPRAAGPFVAVNCATLPEPRIEIELFGSERGAAPGAARAHPGLFEQAHGGTLFLDEIAEVPSQVQVSLLRALEDQTTRRVGGTRRRPVDVRVMAATYRDPKTAVAAGRLRGDLYYRLGVLEFHLPPLRERREDIPALAEHFLAHFAQRHDSPLRNIGGAALDLLEAYAWPGNVRELENAIERATVLATPADGDVLRPEHLPKEIGDAEGTRAAVAATGPELSLAAAMRRLRRRYVVEALRRAGGNKTEAARLLGLSRRALYGILDQLQLEDKAH